MKLPQFEAMLAEYYRGVHPHERVCAETGEIFFINQRDLEMYRSLNVPLPTVSPLARYRRLRASVAGCDLFRRTMSDGSQVITMYEPDSPVPLLPQAVWRSDAFDAMAYGRDYDFSRSFFDQWKDFSFSVPRPDIYQHSTSENSPWAVYGLGAKNCYFTYEGMENEDVSYGDFCVVAKHSCDVSTVYRSSDCYECAHLNECSGAMFCVSCEGCINVTFCLACRNCSDCFGCTNLRSKRFCFLNEQLAEEEYRARMRKIDLSDAGVLEEWRTKVHKNVWDKAFRRAGILDHSEQALGDDLVNCHNVEGVSMNTAERVYHSFGLTDVKDTIDLTLGMVLERSVNLVNSWKGYENKMVSMCEGCMDVEYSDLLVSCEHCFGCIGLKRKKFCIFNKQYTEEEYRSLVDRIKTDMLKRGEYGEFFPYAVSTWAYNTSHADVQFPLTEEEAKRLGARWYSFSQERQGSAEPMEALPLRLEEATHEILTKAYRCPETGRAVRFVKPELDLHRELGIALPRVHPTVRRKRRLAQLFPMVLVQRSCADCGTKVSTRIPATYPAPVLCEVCYEKRVLAS